MINDDSSSNSESDDVSSSDNSEINFDLNIINELNDLRILKEKIDSLEKKVDRILELLESDCKKMRNHIDFVENVYDNVKTPFNYVMNSVNSLIFVNSKLAIENVDHKKAIMDERKFEIRYVSKQ